MDLEQKSFLSVKNILIILFVIIVLNLISLDILIFNNNFSSKTTNDLSNKISEKNDIEKPTDLKPSQNISETCPAACISKINETIKALPPVFPSETSQSTSTSDQQITSGVKEFFIPFGVGSSSAADWTDISGLQAYVDSAQYGRFKKVTFEASVRIPTGNETAYVRLYNVSDKHPVWFSEVSIEGGTPKLLISNPIALDSGNKLYQVQMKTSLQYQAILDQARIHILTY